MNCIPFSYPLDCDFYRSMSDCLFKDSIDDICIFIHAHPDGDAVGSAYALAYILKSHGKRAKVFCSDVIPQKFDYITDFKFPEFTPKFAVTVDVASPELIGQDITLPVICAVDHHLKNSVNADQKFIKSEKCSCGEIIFEFAMFADMQFDQYLALCLHTAISTDSGCFKYEAVNDKTFLAAAYLSKFIPQNITAKINRRNFDTKTLNQLKVEKYAIDNVHTYFGGTLAICTFTQEIKAQLGATDEDMESLSQIPRQIDTVETSVVIKPKSENLFKVSVRTKEYVDAALFCSNFGGGGHKRASGCTISGSAEQVEQKIVDMYREKIIQR